MFGRWRSGLGDDVDLYAVSLPGREEKLKQTPRTDLHALADELADELLASPILEQPLVLVGFSLGGMLAYEIATRLQHRGRAAALVVAASTRAPQVDGGRAGRGKLHTITDDTKFLKEMNRLYSAVPPALLENDEMRTLLTPMLRGDITMVETYRHRSAPVLDAEIMTMLGTKDSVIRPKHVLPWRELTRRYRHRTLDGDHYFERTHRDAVLNTIKRRIARLG